MHAGALAFRAARPSDAQAAASLFIAGFESYRSFAPPGWEPPPLAGEVDATRGLLAEEGLWCRLAEQDGQLAGLVMVVPAAQAVHAIADPELAHLRGLFVAEDFWGTGLAGVLHRDALDAASGRGFTQMRLFTPARHARARRFYEREGWAQAGEEFDEQALGLVLVEYRRPVP